MNLIGYMDPDDLNKIDSDGRRVITVSGIPRLNGIIVEGVDPAFSMDTMAVYAGDHSAGLEEFQRHVDDNWNSRRFRNPNREPGSPDFEELRQDYIMALGLVGEAGEAAELLKKWIRDGNLDVHKLLLELGDIVRYAARIASRHGSSLSEVCALNIAKIDRRNLVGKENE